MISALGTFEQLVLLAILQLGDRAYGLEIAREIERHTERSTSRSALYVTFDRLEKKGYLASRLGDPSAERGGRPKRFVRVTRAGVRAVRDSRRTLLSLWRGLDSVLEDR